MIVVEWVLMFVSLSEEIHAFYSVFLHSSSLSATVKELHTSLFIIKSSKKINNTQNSKDKTEIKSHTKNTNTEREEAFLLSLYRNISVCKIDLRLPNYPRSTGDTAVYYMFYL